MMARRGERQHGWSLGRSRSTGAIFGRYRIFLFFLIALPLGLSRPVLAQESELPTIFCPIVSKAPTIDGTVGEEEWGESTILDAFIPEAKEVPSWPPTGEPAKAGPSRAKEAPEQGDILRDTQARLMADPDALYLAFICEGPDGKPKLPRERERDEVSTADDCVEVTLDLNHNHADLNLFLVGYYGDQTDIARHGRYDKGWNASWKSAVHRGESSWSVEMAIPVRELTGEAIRPGRTSGIQLVRYRPGLASRSYLTKTTAPSYPDLVFGPPGVAIAQTFLPGWKQGLNTVRLKLKNYGEAAEAVSVAARTASSAGEKEWEAKTISIEGSSEAELALTGHVLGDWENGFDLKLSRKKTGQELYSSTYRFSPRGAADEHQGHWNVKTSGAVCFQPDPFRVELTQTRGTLRDRMVRATAELTSRDSGQMIGGWEYGTMPGGYVNARADTSRLPDGHYAFRVLIAGDDGKVLLETLHDFVCVADEFKGVRAAISELSRATEVGEFRGAVFDEGAESLHFARSSFLFMEHLVTEARRQIEAGTVETYREKLMSAQELLGEAKRLREAFQEGEDPLEGQTGVLQRAFVSPYDKELCPYAVFVPSGYDGSKPFPLVVDLLADGPTPDWKLGAGEKRRYPWESVVASLEKHGFIMAWPRPTRRLKAEVNFFAVLEEMKKDYNIDPDRIYLIGASGGGLRSWLIGLHYPDQIAAIAPISGLTVCTEATEKPWITSRAIVKELSAYYFPMNALHLPVIVLHGDADPVTRADVQARPMVEKMRELGLEVEYVEYPRGIHTLVEEYDDAFERAMAFFDRHRNVRHPSRIDFTTSSPRYDRAYWIRIGKIVQKGEFARVRAEAKGNILEIKTDNIGGLSVLPDAQVLDVRAPVAVTIDGQSVFEVKFPETGGMGFVKDDEGMWQSK